MYIADIHGMDKRTFRQVFMCAFVCALVLLELDTHSSHWVCVGGLRVVCWLPNAISLSMDRTIAECTAPRTSESLSAQCPSYFPAKCNRLGVGVVY